MCLIYIKVIKDFYRVGLDVVIYFGKTKTIKRINTVAKVIYNVLTAVEYIWEVFTECFRIFYRSFNNFEIMT